MNNSKMILVIGTVAILGTGGYLYLRSAVKPDSMMKETETIPENNAMMEDDKADSMKGSSRYVEYSPAQLADAAPSRRVLFFYASWCPTCIPADADFKENSSKIPEDVTVIRVNYNDPETDEAEKELAKTYGITYQHTFVQIDSNGKDVAKWNGGSINEFLENIQ